MRVLFLVGVGTCWTFLCGGTVDVSASDSLTAALARPVLPPTAALSVWDALYAEVDAADAAADAAWMQIKTPADFSARADELRERMVTAMGGLPPRPPVQAQVTRSFSRNGYRVENVLFLSRPGGYVTANLYLPTSPSFSAPFPASLLLCGHDPNGKATPKYVRLAIQLARAGIAVMAVDPVRQGERRHKTDGSVSPTRHHSQLGVNAELLGHGLSATVVHDAQCALDYLQTRADIRRTGFGCVGNSGGGTQTALLAAIDSRIVASVPNCYLGNLRTQNYARGFSDCEQFIRGQLVFGLNHAGYVLLSSGPVRIQAARNDIIPYYGTRETFRTVSAVAAAVGRRDVYSMFDVPGPHGLAESHRLSAVEFFRHHLRGEACVLKDEDFRRGDDSFDLATADCGPSPADLQVTATGYVLDLPDARDDFDFLRAELAQARSAYDSSRIQQHLPALRAGVCGGWRPAAACAEERVGEVAIQRSTCWVRDGFSLPVVTACRANVKGLPILLVGDSGRAALASRVERLVEAGGSVTVVDLMGWGETGKSRNNIAHQAPEDEEMGKMLYVLGSSLVVRRAEQIRDLAAEMKSRHGMPVRLIAEGRAAIPAAHAYAADRGLFSACEFPSPPKSWSVCVAEEVTTRYADAVPGALCHYDWTDLANPSRFDIRSYGARNNGSKATAAFAAAIDAAHKAGGGRVEVPAGTWFTGPIHLKSNVELHLDSQAMVEFSSDVADYLPAVRTSFSCMECYNYSPLVYAADATNVAVTGGGVFAPRMDTWRAWFNRNTPEMFHAMGVLYGWGENDEPLSNRRLAEVPGAKFRPSCVEFDRCSNVRLEGFRIRESPCWCVHVRLCSDVTIRGLDIKACGHNNDGIDVDASQRVLIEDCLLVQGDDGIVIKSGRDRDGRRIGVPTEDVLVRNCTLRAGHTLLAVGSEVAGGVRNITMHDCRADGVVSRLVGIKTSDRKGAYVENVVVSNIVACNVRVAVASLRTGQDYQWGKYPARERKVTRIKGFHVSNVRCRSAGHLFEFEGDARLPAQDISLCDVYAEKISNPSVATNVEGMVANRVTVKPLPELHASPQRALYSEEIKAWPAQVEGENLVWMRLPPFSLNPQKSSAANGKAFRMAVEAQLPSIEAALASCLKEGKRLLLSLPEAKGVSHADRVRAWSALVHFLHYNRAHLATAFYGFDLRDDGEDAGIGIRDADTETPVLMPYSPGCIVDMYNVIYWVPKNALVEEVGEFQKRFGVRLLVEGTAKGLAADRVLD